MMPRLFEIPLPGGLRLPINSFGVVVVLGFLIASYVASREARRRGLPDLFYELGMVMLFSGIVGGRALYYIENYEAEYAGRSFLELFKIWHGGLVFYGGAITGMLGGLFYMWKKALSFPDWMDVAALGAPIAMGVGRLGCFLNGCCFGSLCDPDLPLPASWLVFPAGSPAAEAHEALGLTAPGQGASLPVHPVQLYQLVHDLLLAGFFFWLYRKAGFPRGAGMPILFIFYGLGRFFLEFLRADNAVTFSGLTISQNLSLLLILVFAGWLGVEGRLFAEARKGPKQIFQKNR